MDFFLYRFPCLDVPLQMHYNCPAFFTKTYNPADDGLFKREVEKTGSKCAILDMGGSIGLTDE